MSYKPRKEVTFFVEKYLGSQRVLDMTWEEEGAYDRALFVYYHSGYLFADETELAKQLSKPNVPCTIELAKKVKSMFRPHHKYVTLLEHDMEKQLNNAEEGFMKKAAEAKEEDKVIEKRFLEWIEVIKSDTNWIENAVNVYRIDADSVVKIIEEFSKKQIGIFGYKKIHTIEGTYSFIFNSIKYSEIYKSFVEVKTVPEIVAVPIPEDIKNKLLKFLNDNKQKYYPNELVRAQDELDKYAKTNNITDDVINENEVLKIEFDQMARRIFNKHVRSQMIFEIEKFWNHYAKYEFKIAGIEIKNWLLVLPSWMDKRDERKVKK